MTPADDIRKLAAKGWDPSEIHRLCGYSRQQIYAALKASPKIGRPRKGKVCSTCKRPWPKDDDVQVYGGAMGGGKRRCFPKEEVKK